MTLTIDGGTYGERKYTWGNLSLVPNDFVWDRHFGEVVAPIGEYPVTVSAADTLGNSAAATGQIVIPDLNASGGGSADPDGTSTTGLAGNGSTAPPLSVASLLGRLPKGDLATTGQVAGLIVGGVERSSPSSGPAIRDGAAPSEVIGEVSTTDTLSRPGPSTVASGRGVGLLWGAAAPG